MQFPDYENYKSQAEQIAAYIRDIVPTEDGIKEAKTTLAAARRVTDGLNRKRIDLKKQILGNYSEFESQIRSLTGVIDEADSDLRGKVRDLEEQEREEKKQKIRDMWNKRFTDYTLSQLVSSDIAFNRWLQPVHLNKTTTMKAVEMSMVFWLEEREKDLQACRSMGDEYLTEYLLSYDLSITIASVKDRAERAEAVNQLTAEDPEVTAVFYITGKAYISLTERLLKENEINYRKVER